MIDTGLGVANIKKVVDRLTKLPVTVATTHVHWDHIGGHSYFTHIAVYAAERKWLEEEFPIPLQMVKRNLTCKPCEFQSDFSVDHYRIYKGSPDLVFHDGFSFDLGNRQLTAIHTPGHSPGHGCFYEPERKDLYAGDLIYKGCLDAFYPTTDPRQFYQSVKKTLSIDRVLPAHHQLLIPVDLISRIESAFEALDKQKIWNKERAYFNLGISRFIFEAGKSGFGYGLPLSKAPWIRDIAPGRERFFRLGKQDQTAPYLALSYSPVGVVKNKG